ncbi:MAG: hypothetical protein V3U31_01820 [Dehalococcoidia bacterium]
MVDLFLYVIVAWGVRRVGNRLFPVLMPQGRLRPLLWGFLGGVAGGVAAYLWFPYGPRIGGTYLVGAVGGTTILYLAWGMAPFLRIMARRR